MEVLVQYPLMKQEFFVCIWCWNIWVPVMPGIRLYIPWPCTDRHEEGGALTAAHKITEGAFSEMDPALLAQASREPGRSASLRELSASLRVTGRSGCSPQSCCCQDDGPSAGSQPMTLPATVTVACSGLLSRFPDAFFFFLYLFIALP